MPPLPPKPRSASPPPPSIVTSRLNPSTVAKPSPSGRRSRGNSPTRGESGTPSSTSRGNDRHERHSAASPHDPIASSSSSSSHKDHHHHHHRESSAATTMRPPGLPASATMRNNRSRTVDSFTDAHKTGPSSYGNRSPGSGIYSTDAGRTVPGLSSIPDFQPRNRQGRANSGDTSSDRRMSQVRVKSPRTLLLAEGRACDLPLSCAAPSPELTRTLVTNCVQQSPTKSKSTIGPRRGRNRMSMLDTKTARRTSGTEDVPPPPSPALRCARTSCRHLFPC